VCFIESIVIEWLSMGQKRCRPGFVSSEKGKFVSKVCI
jgi:hypothetical protein